MLPFQNLMYEILIILKIINTIENIYKFIVINLNFPIQLAMSINKAILKFDDFKKKINNFISENNIAIYACIYLNYNLKFLKKYYKVFEQDVSIKTKYNELEKNVNKYIKQITSATKTIEVILGTDKPLNLIDSYFNFSFNFSINLKDIVKSLSFMEAWEKWTEPQIFVDFYNSYYKFRESTSECESRIECIKYYAYYEFVAKRYSENLNCQVIKIINILRAINLLFYLYPEEYKLIDEYSKKFLKLESYLHKIKSNDTDGLFDNMCKEFNFIMNLQRSLLIKGIIYSNNIGLTILILKKLAKIQTSKGNKIQFKNLIIVPSNYEQREKIILNENNLNDDNLLNNESNHNKFIILSSDNDDIGLILEFNLQPIKTIKQYGKLLEIKNNIYKDYEDITKYNIDYFYLMDVFSTNTFHLTLH